MHAGMVRAWLIFVTSGFLLFACASERAVSRPSWIHAARAQSSCRDAPPTAPATGFRHRGNAALSRLGMPMHRTIDPIHAADATEQRIEGQLTYGADKSSDDEDVELFACVTDRWHSLGAARTDDDGRFALTLSGTRRLGPGLHALYASALADRSGVGFVAYIAPRDARVAVVDVDGTLTSSENGIVRAVVFGSRLSPQPGAPDALRQLAANDIQLVYLTARPRGTTSLTRSWLSDRGFPPGPIITAAGITLPGDAALAHKTAALGRLQRAGIKIGIGIGNRATDVVAYTRAGLAGDRIFMKSPAYAVELEPYVTSRKAIAFEHYGELPALVAQR